MSSSIEKDVITEEDAVQDVKQHLEEEIRTEKILGKRYITEIDDGGSTVERIN